MVAFGVGTTRQIDLPSLLYIVHERLLIGPMPSDEGMLIVTVCRKSGESPVETCTKLKILLEEWHEFYCGERNGDEDMVARTLTMINPEKKD